MLMHPSVRATNSYYQSIEAVVKAVYNDAILAESSFSLIAKTSIA
jgi:hypothetical protein